MYVLHTYYCVKKPGEFHTRDNYALTRLLYAFFIRFFRWCGVCVVYSVFVLAVVYWRPFKPTFQEFFISDVKAKNILKISIKNILFYLTLYIMDGPHGKGVELPCHAGFFGGWSFGSHFHTKAFSSSSVSR